MRFCEMMDNKALVTYSIFEGRKSLLAFTTTRQTLGIENVRFSGSMENRNELARVLDISPGKLVFPEQTHTSCVLELSEHPGSPIDNTDALVTATPGLCLCVQTADCVPILLFDPVSRVVSAIHAGWRGTVGKIAGVSIARMVEKFRCKPENILAVIGPSISPEVYEVGEEVVEAARAAIPNSELTLWKNDSGKFHFNLWEANRRLLLDAGLLAANIEVIGECTYRGKENYYSARRDGINTGRLVSGIMIL